MTIKEQLTHLQDVVNEAGLDNQIELLNTIEKEFSANELKDEEVYWVLKGEILNRQGLSSEVIALIHEGLSRFPNSYELYYLSGNAFDQLQRKGAACISYHAAFFWGRHTSDAEFLYQNMQMFKETNAISEWEMTDELEQLVKFRMILKEYDETQTFLNWLFFSDPGKTKGMYLSEGTMLQYIMLETTLCERNRLDQEIFETENTCIRLNNEYRNLLRCYLEIKHAVRRIWMGMSDPEKEYLFEVWDRYAFTPELLVVITKYSVEEAYWVSTFKEIAEFVERYSENYADIIKKYARAVEKMTQKKQKDCYRLGETKISINPRRVYLSSESSAVNETFLSAQQKDENKIAIIFCTNDELMERECILYLQHLNLPAGMKLEVLPVWNAKGMCYGYNRVIAQTDAKYKLYIHHDCFLIKEDILNQVLDVFRKESQWKMLGIAGSTVMDQDYHWGYYHYTLVRYNLYQDKVLETRLSHSVQMNGKVEAVKAMDGVFIATSEDIPWREDVFDEWHFYDISQSYEFRKRGYRTGIINDEMPWMIHETTTKKDPKDRYDHYGKKFAELYLQK